MKKLLILSVLFVGQFSFSINNGAEAAGEGVVADIEEDWIDVESLIDEIANDFERHSQNMNKPALANRPSYEESLDKQVDALEREEAARKAGERAAEIKARADFLNALRAEPK